jgi:hypothetical protein
VTPARVADAVGVGAAKLAASLAVVTRYFFAVSDDDFARIVIAQRFAEAPHLDPSGTSWLPLPFWLYGTAFRLFGGSLAVAQGVAVCLGVGAALLLLRAAYLLGAGRAGALIGALLAALFPWSVYLGAAAVPEVPTAALCVFGVATLAVDTWRERAFGAVALAAACFSRYEAWPVAATFAAFTLLEARRSRDVRAALLAVIALGPIALWLLHGVFVHGDALFFWKRVAAYKLALGKPAPLGERLAEVPHWLLLNEPELSIGLLVALIAYPANLRSYRRPAVAALALLAFLAAGEIGGGGPTHHAERAVLPIWFLLALALGEAVGQSFELRPRWSNTGVPSLSAFIWRYAAYGYPLIVLAFGWHYFHLKRSDSNFESRAYELEAGKRARELGAPGLLIDTNDYGYLAVIAAFGKPGAAVPFDDRDPRHPRAQPFTSLEALKAVWARYPNAWLAMGLNGSNLALARRAGRVRDHTPFFTLIAPGPPTDLNDESASTPSVYPRSRHYK